MATFAKWKPKAVTYAHILTCLIVCLPSQHSIMHTSLTTWSWCSILRNPSRLQHTFSITWSSITVLGEALEQLQRQVHQWNGQLCVSPQEASTHNTRWHDHLLLCFLSQTSYPVVSSVYVLFFSHAVRAQDLVHDSNNFPWRDVCILIYRTLMITQLLITRRGTYKASMNRTQSRKG